MSAPPVILVDNHDSFTFNLVEAFQRLGSAVRVFRNSASAGDLLDQATRAGALLVLSPGPGGPEEAGCCLDLVDRARGRVPLLGICLGHQAIAHAAGAAVARVALPVHGKTTELDHDGKGPFRGVPRPTRVGRYHSLGVGELPPDLQVHARADGVAMAFSAPERLQVGLQFHPESILTSDGDHMLANILEDAAAAMRGRA